jgi:hypothetical protein
MDCYRTTRRVPDVALQVSPTSNERAGKPMLSWVAMADESAHCGIDSDVPAMSYQPMLQ